MNPQAGTRRNCLKAAQGVSSLEGEARPAARPGPAAVVRAEPILGRAPTTRSHNSNGLRASLSLLGGSQTWPLVSGDRCGPRSFRSVQETTRPCATRSQERVRMRRRPMLLQAYCQGLQSGCSGLRARRHRFGCSYDVEKDSLHGLSR